jgi:hypothetical protein
LIFKLLLVLDGFWPTGGRWVHERRLADLVKSRFGLVGLPAQWDGEIIWMSLYFSVVWASLALCRFTLLKDELARYTA